MNSSYSDGTTVPKVSPLLLLGPNPVPLIGCIGCRSIILKPVDDGGGNAPTGIRYAVPVAAKAATAAQNAAAVVAAANMTQYGTVGLGDSKEIALRGGEKLFLRTEEAGKSCTVIWEMNWE